MFLLLDMWHHKSQKKDLGLGRAVQDSVKLKMAEVDQEMMLLILFSSSPGGNHENWALVVSVVARNIVIWGSCSPKLLGEDSTERMGDSDQPVAEMCSCLQISAWLKKWDLPIPCLKASILRWKLMKISCVHWLIHIFHRFSLPFSEDLCSLLILHVIPLLQKLCEKWASIKQNLVSTKSVHKNLVCSLQMRAMDLEDQIKVICFQHTNKPMDVIKLPSQQWRSHWAFLGGKINGLYSFTPCAILLLMRTEKKSFILYTVQYNRDFIIHFPGLLAVKGLGNPI